MPSITILAIRAQQFTHWSKLDAWMTDKRIDMHDSYIRSTACEQYNMRWVDTTVNDTVLSTKVVPIRFSPNVNVFGYVMVMYLFTGFIKVDHAVNV